MKYKIIMSILFLLFLVGCKETPPSSTEVAKVTCYDLCEYSKGDLYFKAPCNDIRELIRLKIERQHFEEYISKTIDEFENNCREFVAENIYYNFKKHNDYFENVTLEEFKQGEDTQMIINFSCEVH